MGCHFNHFCLIIVRIQILHLFPNALFFLRYRGWNFIAVSSLVDFGFLSTCTERSTWLLYVDLRLELRFCQIQQCHLWASRVGLCTGSGLPIMVVPSLPSVDAHPPVTLLRWMIAQTVFILGLSPLKLADLLILCGYKTFPRKVAVMSQGSSPP